MKNHNLKLLAVLMAVVLAASLTACAKKAQESAPAAQAASDEVPEEETDSKKDTDEVPEESQVTDDNGQSSDENDPNWDGPIGDEEYDGPSNFLEDQAGRTEFKDDDDVISCLKSGQGYAVINLKGADNSILLVAEKISAEGTTPDASAYGKYNGTYMGLTDIGSFADDADILRLEDGILYSGTSTTYESHFLDKDSGSIIGKDWVMKGTDEGKDTYTGFLREENDFDHDKNFEGGAEEFDAMIKERSEKAPLIFTVVK